MQTLAGEWKKREKEREDIFQRKVDEYIKLEEKLKLVGSLVSLLVVLASNLSFGLLKGEKKGEKERKREKKREKG